MAMRYNPDTMQWENYTAPSLQQIVSAPAPAPVASSGWSMLPAAPAPAPYVAPPPPAPVYTPPPPAPAPYVPPAPAPAPYVAPTPAPAPVSNSGWSLANMGAAPAPSPAPAAPIADPMNGSGGSGSWTTMTPYVNSGTDMQSVLQNIQANPTQSGYGGLTQLGQGQDTQGWASSVPFDQINSYYAPNASVSGGTNGVFVSPVASGYGGDQIQMKPADYQALVNANTGETGQSNTPATSTYLGYDAIDPGALNAYPDSEKNPFSDKTNEAAYNGTAYNTYDPTSLAQTGSGTFQGLGPDKATDYGGALVAILGGGVVGGAVTGASAAAEGGSAASAGSGTGGFWGDAGEVGAGGAGSGLGGAVAAGSDGASQAAIDAAAQSAGDSSLSDIVSKAALDGTNSFGANSVGNALDISALNAAAPGAASQAALSDITSNLGYTPSVTNVAAPPGVQPQNPVPSDPQGVPPPANPGPEGVPPPANPGSSGLNQTINIPGVGNVSLQQLGSLGTTLSQLLGGSSGSTGATGSTSTGGLNLGNLANIIGGVAGVGQQGQAANDMKSWLQGQQAKIDNLYNPGTPEYNALWDEMSRKDAAAGRNSQYGPRSVDLAARVAQIKADETQKFTTGTANAYSNALNQNAAKYAGLLSALGAGSTGGGIQNLTSFINSLTSTSPSASDLNNASQIGVANSLSDAADYQGANWGAVDPASDPFAQFW